MVSPSAMTDPMTWPSSGLKYGPVHVSGASTTPSTDTIRPATIFRIASPSRDPSGQPIRPLSAMLRTRGSRMDTAAADSFHDREDFSVAPDPVGLFVCDM